MGSARRLGWRWGMAVSLVLAVSAATAWADVTTERSSSILIFPKVLFDTTGTQTGGIPVDTIIQISNTSNSMVFAHCFYVNASPVDPTRAPGSTNPREWQEVDFDVFLTKQQPTHWLVSAGRRINPVDNQGCSVDCSNAGFDPGAIPPVPDHFTGELKCIEVDSSGAPINGNHLKGEATIVTLDGRADTSKYNAIGLLGLNTDLNANNGDDTLCLGGGATPGCPNGAEYNGCPQRVILDHFAENATDPVVEALGNGASRVFTELTIVPCSEDFENQIPATVTVQFLMINEFEQTFSTSAPVTCWANLRLSQIGSIGRIFDVSLLGTRFVQTRMTAPDFDGSGNPMSGFVGITEEFHQQPTSTTPIVSRAALNLHGEGVRQPGDTIILPGAF
ncbi:MAG: hypothetical protein ACE5I7_08625 [Candidatus Binatia bacterium]